MHHGGERQGRALGQLHPQSGGAMRGEVLHHGRGVFALQRVRFSPFLHR